MNELNANGRWPAGASQLAERLRAFKWEATSLGPTEAWPHHLKAAVDLLLPSGLPMVALWGPDLIQIYNDGYCALMGAKHPSGLGKPTREVWPEVWHINRPIYDRVLAGETLSFEDALYPVHRQDALEDAWFTLSYSPLRGDFGDIAGVLVVVVETTDRIKADSALLKTEARLRALLAATYFTTYRMSADWSSMHELDGRGLVDTHNATGTWLANSIDPDDQPRVLAAIDTAIRSKTVFDLEHKARRIDGTLGWTHFRAVPIFDDQGGILEWFGAAGDITARKAAEAALRDLNDTLELRIESALAEKKTLAAIVEATDSFVQVVDADYRWIAINKASADEFERIFGVRPKTGDTFTDVLRDHPDHLARVTAVWRRALAGEEFVETGEFGNPERASRHYEMRFRTLRDKAGLAIGAYQFVHDVTDRVRGEIELLAMQAALQQSQKLEAIGQLTGGVAHDFNNLLTPIIGGLDLLLRRSVDERSRRLIDGALQSAERAKVLVQRLLAFARRQPLRAAAVDVKTLVSGMAELVASTSGPQIKVVVDIADGLPAAMTDPNQLEMAILNLSVNARDAMVEGGTLRISGELELVGVGHRSDVSPGLYIRLSVADTGVGMGAETLSHAIEPFYSTKGVGEGTGLGLSMAHGLASQLGGALKITSALGLGTNVELWLPTTSEAAVAPDSQTGVARPIRSGTVLLVDDEPLVRMSTAEMLADLGFAVVEAHDGADALRLVGEGLSIDLLVTDHVMPGMTGVELTRRLRAGRPGLPVLMISGFAEEASIDPDLPRLTKPFRQVDLAASIATLVD